MNPVTPGTWYRTPSTHGAANIYASIGTEQMPIDVPVATVFNESDVTLFLAAKDLLSALEELFAACPRKTTLYGSQTLLPALTAARVAIRKATASR